jgi:ABC-type multidrug transport system ATPase subunit
MQITLTDTGKRYNREWIFRHFSFDFMPGKTYAVTGPNGSGKSTLLQVVAGAILHSEGKIDYYQGSDKSSIPTGDAYKKISLATPYLELVEEMTAGEMLAFHAGFKEFSHPANDILAAVTLEKAAHKQIRYFSSGMKQRLKLGMAFFSKTPVLLLDEPTTNLDAEGIALYLNLIENHSRHKLVIISSNDVDEYKFCEEVISISDYK